MGMVKCPKCESEDVHWITIKLNRKTKYRCRNCSHEFWDDEHD